MYPAGATGQTGPEWQARPIELQFATVKNTKLKHEIGKMGAETSLINQNRIKMNRALNMIDQITDPVHRAELYKKVFSECCDVPQSGCGCNDKQ